MGLTFSHILFLNFWIIYFKKIVQWILVNAPFITDMIIIYIYNEDYEQKYLVKMQ